MRSVLLWPAAATASTTTTTTTAGLVASTSTSSTVETGSNIDRTTDSRQAVDVNGHDDEMVALSGNLALNDDKGIPGTTTGAAVGCGDDSGAVDRHLAPRPSARKAFLRPRALSCGLVLGEVPKTDPIFDTNL